MGLLPRREGPIDVTVPGRKARNRPGIRIHRATLHPADATSEAERRALDLIRRAGLPPPETNAQLRGYEVDLLWREQRLVVEIDGYAFHSSRRSFERDRRKDQHLQTHGYRVIRITWRQLTEEPEAVVATITRALAERS